MLFIFRVNLVIFAEIQIKTLTRAKKNG